VDPQIFTRRVVADCMSHGCRVVAPAGRERDMLDACCQYGVDVDLAERARIAERAPEIRGLLHADAKDIAWFDDDPTADDDAPSGAWVRTNVHGAGCVFLAHDRRGCAIHRASLAGGWDFRGTKPHICRLFPLSYTHDAIVIAEEYEDYSCAFEADAPTLYRVGRDTLGDVFGVELVAALDAVEARAAAPHRLPIAR
jgi:Fe-S-cluster containining protein